MSASPDTGPSDELVADVFDRKCPSRGVMEHVGSKWGILSLTALDQRPMRFNALRRTVTGVSEKMLSQTLHTLERDGFVHREVHTSIPPHVEYSVTPLGHRVAVKLAELIDLLEDTLDESVAAQEAYDKRVA
ncbi:winged helix-turn-helix transcriptional regulator [Stackebrandtia nassauensis]|uniref:Transcriptional regulator, HxlR family n=1 Tax=Stackebrandtia nassauensis (strain DSM 44728 / CIP 108903 / NRRL B-16338 / NBRC 102104 / LLR-40K-21) TaxID=446470 RepID=D3PZN7_STANL|nr:helix-turn-helix domain-containing protein [Stackebrandtia nassauensis]ADD43574.1 transcriptional regulator, HxlR family [Stackebrandtia nassauensis DSM 44728]